MSTFNKCILHSYDTNLFPSGCKALKDDAARQYQREGKCGTYKCPFYKERPEEKR